MRVVVDDGTSLAVDTWTGGDGVPFLLSHGLASNRRTWERAAARLHELGHPVATVDLRGHGASDKPDQGYDFTTLGADLVRVLDVVGFASAVLAGQSTGGNIVVDVGARHPDRVAGVAGVDGGALEPSRRWPDWDACRAALAPPALAGSSADAVEAMLRRGHPSWSDWAIEATMASFDRRPDGTVRPWLSVDRHVRILRSLWEHRPSTLIPTLEMPVLLVMADTGDAWSEHKRSLVAEVTAASARVRVEWFAPGDHDLHVQCPMELAELLHRYF